MRRTFFTFAAVASLLLCVGALALSVRSFVAFDQFLGSWTAVNADGSADVHSIGLLSSRGGFGPYCSHQQLLPAFVNELGLDADQFKYPLMLRHTNQGAPESYVRWGMPGDQLRGAGFQFVRHVQGSVTAGPPAGAFSGYYLVIPAWFAVAMFAVLPSVMMTRLVRKRRRLSGRCCSNCGYDLRATPDRCPECGCEASPAAAVTETKAASSETRVRGKLAVARQDVAEGRTVDGESAMNEILAELDVDRPAKRRRASRWNTV
jgi:hypothetical protein